MVGEAFNQAISDRLLSRIVNNAGIGVLDIRLHEMDLSTWDKNWQVLTILLLPLLLMLYQLYL